MRWIINRDSIRYCYLLFTVRTSSLELFVHLLCEINQSVCSFTGSQFKYGYVSAIYTLLHTYCICVTLSSYWQWVKGFIGCEQILVLREEEGGRDDELRLCMIGQGGVCVREIRTINLQYIIKQYCIHEFHFRICCYYSGGDRRKLTTASALIGAPPLVFLDEPTRGMDPASKRLIWEEISRACGQGSTVLYTSFK